MKHLRFLLSLCMLFTFVFGIGTTQAAFVDYFDADGGGIITGESLSTDRNMQIGGTLTVGSQAAAQFALDIASGYIGFNPTGGGSAFYDANVAGTAGLCYANSATGLVPASSTGEMPCYAFGMGSGKYLLSGFVSATVPVGAAVGDLLYVGDAGALTATPPSADNQSVQAVALVVAADRIYFNPSLVYFELGADTSPELGGDLDVKGYTIFDSTAALVPNEITFGKAANPVSTLSFVGASFKTELVMTTPTANQVVTFQDKTGTVALLSDISDLLADGVSDGQTLYWEADPDGNPLTNDAKWMPSSALTNDNTDVIVTNDLNVGATAVIASGLTVTAGGATITDNSSIDGDLSISGATTVTGGLKDTNVTTAIALGDNSGTGAALIDFTATSIVGALNELKKTGGSYTTRTPFDGSITATVTDGPILASTNATAGTVTLPTCDATSNGKLYTIKDEGGSGSVTINGTIDGSAGGFVIREPYNSVDIYCVSGTGWFIK